MNLYRVIRGEDIDVIVILRERNHLNILFVFCRGIEVWFDLKLGEDENAGLIRSGEKLCLVWLTN